MPCVRAERATAPQRIGPGRDNMNGYDHSLLFLLFFLSSLAVSNLYPQRFKLAAALLCAPPFHPPATADRGGRVRLGGRDRASERSEHCGDRPPRGRHRAGEETARFHCSHSRKLHNKAIDHFAFVFVVLRSFFDYAPMAFLTSAAAAVGFAGRLTQPHKDARTHAHQLCPSHKTRKIPL